MILMVEIQHVDCIIHPGVGFYQVAVEVLLIGLNFLVGRCGKLQMRLHLLYIFICRGSKQPFHSFSYSIYQSSLLPPVTLHCAVVKCVNELIFWEKMLEGLFMLPDVINQMLHL